MADNMRAVPIGEIIVSDAAEDVLVAYGLGSCVAVCLYDPAAQVGGMLHALLPSAPSHNGNNPTPSAKFVDQGTPLLVESLLRLGARRTRLIAQLCGGAQVLSAPSFDDGVLNIGQRNVLAAEAALRAARLRIHAQDTGGCSGRTVKLHVANGRVTVKSLGLGEQALQEGNQQENGGTR
jgi:chemotaxis protein CheD